MSAEKLVVFFPGAGYGVDAPLLYYSDLLFELKGYRHLYVNYTQPWEEQVTKAAGSASTVIFVSKSIGAVAAGKSAEQIQNTVRQIFITPVGAALPYIQPGCRVVIGTADQDYASVHKWCEDKGIACLSIEGADHSLELAGQLHQSIDLLHQVVDFISAIDQDAALN